MEETDNIDVEKSDKIVSAFLHLSVCCKDPE